MAVRIRLTRVGRLNRPFYRIGVFDSRTRRDGQILEQLGFYDPLHSTGKDKPEWKLDRERLDFWMKKGALPSESIAAYLKSEKVVFFDAKRKIERHRSRAATRKASRRKTGRTVEKTAKPVMPKAKK